MTKWDPSLYLKFGDERTRAACELLSRVPLPTAKHVVDLGCGPGNSTALLVDRFPTSHVTGVDMSLEMLETARRGPAEVTWVEADVSTWRPPVTVDLLFANAVFQWVPNHADLLPALFSCLNAGGALALQMPHNVEQPSHRLMRALPGPFAGRLNQVAARTEVGSPGFYYDLLAPQAAYVDIWQTTYEQVVDSPAAIVEWVKGTGLRPYLDVLNAHEQELYLRQYTDAIADAYPARADGKRLFSFPRFFLVATR